MTSCRAAFHIVAALFIRHIEKGYAVEIDRIGDVGMINIAVEQNVAMTVPEISGGSASANCFADCPAPASSLLNHPLHHFGDREMKNM